VRAGAEFLNTPSILYYDELIFFANLVRELWEKETRVVIAMIATLVERAN
jgi:hypothetical protein